MEQFNKYLPIAIVIIIAVILQGLLIVVNCQDTPNKAAVEFAKAYYRVDPAMSELLCEKYLTVDGDNAVEDYIQRVALEAKTRGFKPNYLKNILYGIETHTHIIDTNKAEVNLHAKRRTSINPVFAHIGKFFFIGKTHAVDETIPMIKEKGKWKVCSNIFSLWGK